MDRIRERLKGLVRPFGPLAPVVALFVLGLLLLTFSRLGLTLEHLTRLEGVPHFWWVFPIGVRMDTVTLSILMFPPAMALLLLPRRLGRYYRPVLAGYFSLCAATLVFMEVATVPFIQQYDHRPDRIFIEYLNYPKEVFSTIWADYKPHIFIAAVLVYLIVRWTWRLSNGLMRDHAHWAYWQRLLAVPVVAIALFLGARSSLDHRAVNISTAAFSSDHLTNEMGLNSSYSVLYAVYAFKNEVNTKKLYGSMPEQEMYRRVRRQMLQPPGSFKNTAIPLLHSQSSRVPRERPYNLVIFLQESLGAEYVGALGGLPLTPNLDRLSREGLFFTNLYATGTRTVRGIEATVSGFLPTAGRSVVKLGLAQDNFFTLARLLRRRGYSTEFIYGGESRFDNMRGFFLSYGFQRVIDQPDFENPVFLGTWGVSDEDLVTKANEVFKAHGDKPFFALMLSTSNHVPFEFPDGRIKLYEQPKATVNNAIKYADYAIGKLFELAKKEDYYKHTIFLVVADHNTRVFGADLVPVKKFHIPALVIGPNIEPRRYDKLASQLDLPPTLVDLMGLDVTTPMVGRDLLNVPADVPGHAFMQYESTNAYRVGERVIISRPYKDPLQFVYRGGRLHPTALDPDFARDALAFIQLPSVLYAQQRYRLPGSPDENPAHHLASH